MLAGLLLCALSFASYWMVARQLDADATRHVIELANGLPHVRRVYC